MFDSFNINPHRKSPNIAYLLSEKNVSKPNTTFQYRIGCMHASSSDLPRLSLKLCRQEVTCLQFHLRFWKWCNNNCRVFNVEEDIRLFNDASISKMICVKLSKYIQCMY